jgi:hypothetical protein
MSLIYRRSASLPVSRITTAADDEGMLIGVVLAAFSLLVLILLGLLTDRLLSPSRKRCRAEKTNY